MCRIKWSKFTKMRFFPFHAKKSSRVQCLLFQSTFFKRKIFGMQIGTINRYFKLKSRKNRPKIRDNFRDLLPRRNCKNQKLIFYFCNFDEAAGISQIATNFAWKCPQSNLLFGRGKNLIFVNFDHYSMHGIVISYVIFPGVFWSICSVSSKF